jgi:transposase
MTNYAEIGIIDIFPSASQLTAHVGYDAIIIPSGQTERFGHIVKRVSSLLRKAIWNYSMFSIRFKPFVTEYYH